MPVNDLLFTGFIAGLLTWQHAEIAAAASNHCTNEEIPDLISDIMNFTVHNKRLRANFLPDPQPSPVTGKYTRPFNCRRPF